jgi:hypothetical protein
MGNKDASDDAIVHRMPGIRDDVYPCCNWEVSSAPPWTMAALENDLVTCDGTPPTDEEKWRSPRRLPERSKVTPEGVIDDAFERMLQEATGQQPADWNKPSDAESGYRCTPLTDEQQGEISALTEKIAELVAVQRDRLIARGFPVEVATGLAAHYHTHLIAGLL